MNKALSLILCNLVFCVFERKQLIIPNRSNDYEKGGLLHKLGLSRRATRETLKALEEGKYISKIKGDKKKKIATEFKVKKKLIRLAGGFLYKVKETYNSSSPEDYVFTKEQSNKEKGLKPQSKSSNSNSNSNGSGKYIRGASQISLPINHPDIQNLHKINSYLSTQTYALQAPIRLIYTGDPFHGGRLYLPIQGLMNREYKVRINTLLNEQQVCEIDLTANHPSMAMALSNKKLDKNFYEIISKAANINYDWAKDYIRSAIGASNRRIKLKELNRYDTAKIDEVIKEKYPGVFDGMYKGMGASYQSLEGQILIKAMLTLIDKDIPSLPIHDAIMVQQQFEKEGKEALENAWMEVLGVKFKPHTSINKP